MNRKSCRHLMLMVVILLAIPLSGMANADGLSQGDKVGIWSYYSQSEEINGIDKAGAMTTKKFGISDVQLESIKTEGRTKNWPLPSEERETDYYTDISETWSSDRLEMELCNSAAVTEADSGDGRTIGELPDTDPETIL